MISPLAQAVPLVKQSADLPPQDLQSSSSNTQDVQSSDLDGLYKKLQDEWKNNGSFTSADVTNYMVNFTNANGERPFKSTQTHVSAIAEILKRLKNEGEGTSAMYAELNHSLGIAVVTQGVLTSFISDMLMRPDGPEPW